MDNRIKERFLLLWRKYFEDAELPIVFYYTDEVDTELSSLTPRCLIANLKKVREGKSLRFSLESIGCHGGRRYCGFTDEISPNFEYFLSYGIPGELKGERYKKSPELVKEYTGAAPKFQAPKKYIVFKPWDMIRETDEPEVVIFFAEPDVLSGLFTLANFDEAKETGIITPFGSGCSSIVKHPYLEKNRGHPRCVIGMFDPSARPYVSANTLTFAVPINKFISMIENMEESFLITPTWTRIQKRIGSV